MSYPIPDGGFRVTADDVNQIIVTDGVSDLTPFIAAAEDLVNEACVASIPEDVTPYSAGRLFLIELWLAAHFYAIYDPRVTMEGAGSVRASYDKNLGLILQCTTYGQQALMLDTKGLLSNLSKGAEKGNIRRIGMMSLGDNPAYGRGVCGSYWRTMV